MSQIYEQTPVRLLLSLISNPPVTPYDQNTGIRPRVWRGEAVALQIGIFDSFGQPLDLSNLTYLQVVIQQNSASIVPLVVKQIPVGSLTTMSAADWAAGIAQQAIVNLLPADTDQGLGGTTSAAFWIIVQGFTALGNNIVYGAGYFDIYDAGISLPFVTTNPNISLNAQSSGVGDITAVPTSVNHTEVVTITGAARTSNVILPISGMVRGSRLSLLLNLPATANIILNVKNALVGGTQLSTITTGQVLTARLDYYYDDIAASWKPLSYTLPAL